MQTTGNYLGRARNFKELTQDLDFALKFIPGSKKINLHAIYQTGKPVERCDVGPEQFKEWVKYAKERGLGLDYNPTIFSHPMLVDGMSLSSPDEKVRNYWIKHCINGLKITEMFGKELGQKSLMNIWIPDGLKRSYIGLDYFDASINRIAAMVIGAHNMEKAILKALLTPLGEVWDEYLTRQNMVSDAKMFKEIREYEKEILSQRQ